MPPRPIVPTWQQTIVPGARLPRLVDPAAGITGQMLDTLAGTSNELLLRAMSAQSERDKREQLAIGRSAGIKAAQSGDAPPEAPGGTFDFLFGKSAGDAAFDQGARTGYLAGISNQIKSGLADAADAAGGDEQKFASGVDEIRGRYAQLPAPLRADVELDIENGALAYAAQIRRTNAARAREQSTVEVRSALDTLAIEAANASRAGDIEAAKNARQRWEAMSGAGVHDGSLTGEWVADKKRQLDSEMMQEGVLGQFYDALDTDGYLAARRYQQDVRKQAPTLGIAPDVADRLNGRMERELDARQADAERAQRQAERATKAAGDGAFKELVDLRAQGKLTFNELERRRGRLSDSQYGQGYTMLQTDLDRSDRARTDPMLFSDLRVRQLRGEDVLPDAQRAYANGQLNYDAFNKIVGEGEQAISESERRVRKYLQDSIRGTGLLATEDQSRRSADADREMTNWLDRQRATKQEPTDDEIWRHADYLRKAYSVQRERPPSSQPLYRRETGGVTDWNATILATTEARAKGEISEDEMQSELDRVAKWIEYEQGQKQREQAVAPKAPARRPEAPK